MPNSRHNKIIQILEKASKPVRGLALAKRLGVSRQVIVQDMAILRASQVKILATPRGYILNERPDTRRKQAVIACRHGRREAEAEWNILVDHGIKVVDIFVDHPLYGELRGLLQLQSRADVRRLLRRAEETRAEHLYTLTNGVHMHTLEAPNDSALRQARAALRKRGILLEHSPRK